MGQIPVRKLGETLWLGDRMLFSEETRQSIETYLELSGSTLRDLAFADAAVRGVFEATYGPIEG